MSSNTNLNVHATPVAEGVRIQIGSATAFAVRQESKDVALRLRREYHPVRDAMERIPFLRGIVRLLGSAADFLDGVSESAQLTPQQIVRGTRFEQRFAELFRIRPTSLVAALSALAILFLLGGLVIVGPWALTRWVLPAFELSRTAVNAVACVARLLCMLLCVLLIPRLRIINRFAAYRGAINKALNAAPAADGSISQASAERASHLSRRSDAAFGVSVLMLSVIAFALIRIFTLPVQILVRLLVVLAIAAILNEPLRLLESARPSPAVNILLAFQLMLERLMTRRPHAQMVEVAVYAWNAARENDNSKGIS